MKTQKSSNLWQEGRVLDVPPGTFMVDSGPRASPEPFEVPRTSLGFGTRVARPTPATAAPPTILEDDDETATRLAEMLSNKVLHL